MEPVYILSGTRTAIGGFGGALKDFAPADLGSHVIAEAVSRAGVAPSDVEHVVMGQVIQSRPKDAYLARVSAINAGLPERVPALTLNRLCGSGLQAIISASQTIALGEHHIAVAGGAEVMSQSPHVARAVRWGQKMGGIPMLDAMIEVLSDPFEDFHMGITAENVASEFGIGREAQDSLAVESHRRASRAVSEGRFDSQITALDVKTRQGVTKFEVDEHVRSNVTLEALSTLRPAFKKDGTVTAGNASGINDGAAAVVLASHAEVQRRSLRPLAKILGWAYAGVDPRLMGIGPVRAVPIALDRAGVDLNDIDVIESNEAFAAQACAVARELGFDSDKTNPNGSGIALGHPVGATGAILTVKALYELDRVGGRFGLITMCIGGGQGIAMVIESTRSSDGH